MESVVTPVPVRFGHDVRRTWWRVNVNRGDGDGRRRRRRRRAPPSCLAHLSHSRVHALSPQSLHTKQSRIVSRRRRSAVVGSRSRRVVYSLAAFAVVSVVVSVVSPATTGRPGWANGFLATKRSYGHSRSHAVNIAECTCVCMYNSTPKTAGTRRARGTASPLSLFPETQTGTEECGVCP